MGLNNRDKFTRADIYKCYLQDISPEDCSERLRFSIRKIKSYYMEFLIQGIRARDSSEDRIIQIKTIEKEMFKSIAINPNSQTTKELINTYCKYLVK